jgi:hypothetical protein
MQLSKLRIDNAIAITTSVVSKVKSSKGDSTSVATYRLSEKSGPF